MDRFSVNLVAPLLKSHGRPSDGKLFSLDVPPILNGDYSQDNLKECDIEVHFSMLGQIMEQAKSLPEGTPISDVSIQD